MFNLQKRIKGIDENKKYMDMRISIREKLLTEEVRELEANLRGQQDVNIRFPNPSLLHEMIVIVQPSEGCYKGGTFKFELKVPPEYNNQPPVVKCLTRVWHPNINEDGAVCLSLLRENSLDVYGWRPTRNITEVVHGLASLFTDLMDFQDPLNQLAAQQHASSPEAFYQKVREYISKYARHH